MPLTAAEQFRVRARRALEEGKPFSARGSVNKEILKEIRAGVENARKKAMDQEAAGEGKREPAQAVDEKSTNMDAVVRKRPRAR
eukprot:1041570-Alexandrium_andersonii.AAC.1